MANYLITILFGQFGLTMASESSSHHGGGGRGGGRRGGGDHGHYMFEEPPLARPPGIHFSNHIIDLPKGDRSRGTIPNIVIFFPSYNCFFLLHMNNS